jgi:hypothetical protein
VLTVLYRIFLFVHVLAAFLYMLAHGASMAVAFRVRRETSAERVRALLDLSQATVPMSNIMLLSTILFGVVLGFLGHWWSARWIWLSVAVLVVVLVVMARMAAPFFLRIRTAAGLVLVSGAWKPAGRESSPEELARALQSGSPAAITGWAVGGWAVILWMMLFKPF